MLRFDYKEQDNGQFHVTVVSEKENSHALAGRLVLEAEEWDFMWKSLVMHDSVGISSDMKTEYKRRGLVKFENKGAWNE